MIAHVLVITLVMRLTFGGPGDSTEVLSTRIYKTAFIGQKPGAASAISILPLIVVMFLTWLALRLSTHLSTAEAIE
ncbi:MAG: hypothetical protein LBD06_05840 [Candidatus Accumulibacter sp.]|jgi:multiple sugar transport system permease protein|nr:hypothetical protein [Accumulibacter sp.]